LLQVQQDVKGVKVGTPIALMVSQGEDWKNVEIPSAAAPPVPSALSAKIKPAVTTHSPLE
jgi:dihydrolipoamide dehydrogenase-binding protein of pyruvate dehydrogenase complex